MHPELIDTLVIPNTTKIVFLIMDGLGGLPGPEGMTELETAQTPNLDALARKGVCGLLDPVGYGVTPGSGPAHFALFGYDPVKNNIGRGILEGAGIDFPMTEKDLLIRINFATMNSDGMIVDRRAGRIDNETNRRICKKLQDNIPSDGDVEVIFQSVKEHRAVLVLRGDGLAEEIQETDPQHTGRAPLFPQALVPEAKYTEAVLSSVIDRAREVLSAEPKANMMLLRGYAKYRKYPSLKDRYLLNALAIASYPMYRGIARLLGMNIARHTETVAEEISLLREHYRDYDFFFVHVKATDSRGEDGNFDGKVAVIEELDALLPRITDLQPDVLVVTGDHSTPAVLASHSWHPVPVILSAPTCRPDMVAYFAERDCIRGGLGRMPMMYLMAQALAHAKRLEKFGA
ncbi:MAG TPA: 2,3-bisphosphoglycerate-independent phosphoglycerate mutase [Syntrophales bacterium]|jgi:2,3-bisphosphoglycerate-independent phosphoglycerate mutase|nr:2,3-bisphosphoglycerate-independent phosphoglycerate mutase [Syntrophales bacterium]HQI36551.1 2,3-bisphosphoglycerate-independent phosphoglycerate mutase [Syntrophales bacterium]HQJ30959.1 2,3-bisphosphoglycerate-independent phosphoglycerate mutase [Syntrophales bacterium]